MRALLHYHDFRGVVAIDPTTRHTQFQSRLRLLTHDQTLLGRDVNAEESEYVLSLAFAC